jgi:hypothetical protein
MLEAKLKGIPVEREKKFEIEYKQTILPHSFLPILFSLMI